MIYNYEELYGIPKDDFPEELDNNEFSIIGSEDEGILTLKLPKSLNLKRPDPSDTVGIDAEIVALLDKLDLGSKLPECQNRCLQVRSVRRDAPLKEPRTPVVSDLSYITCKGNAELEDPKFGAVSQNISRKLHALEAENQAEIEQVKTRKRRDQEERARIIEQERKAREALERQKREDAEKQRKQAEEEARRKQLEEQERKEQERKREAELKKQKEEEEARKLQEQQMRSRGFTDFKKINETLHKYRHRIKIIKTEIVEPVKQDATLKSLLSKHRRKINPKFGQLTNSQQQLQAILSELTGLVDQTRPNKLGYEWILNFIAKAIVSQAETEVRVKPESALPLGKLALALMIRYPELVDFLMARFVKKCPVVIGYTCSIDSEEGRIRMGWRRSSDNKWEDETAYDERMGGIATLFASITRLPIPPESAGPGGTPTVHPIPISHSWQLVARIANTDAALLTNMHFVVLGSWWDATAAQFLLAYGFQARKLLVLISTDLTNVVADKRYVGAARLRILAEEFETSGSISSFPEMTV
ncbi:LAMI_0B05050g1_1 [Lachancea mirantina]|uniref:mRNA export factor GLE1 n=1 Tax=Lachancea mirantina TaxID=1230905 RepID=A0A1G4IVS8_9SACH|nr:LAMI_0B05050g1_1 [Lachancea mirantina]